MSGFPILDLVVGIIFIYFLLCIISNAVVEMVLGFFKLRAAVLSKWLLTIFDKEMIQPDGTTLRLGAAIMDHCVTTGLSKPGKTTAFIDGKNFVTALIEKLSFDPKDPLNVPTTLEGITTSIRNAKDTKGTSLLSTELQRTFLNFAAEAHATIQSTEKKTQSEIDLFRYKIEQWYDSSMDRVEGKLKVRYIRPLTFWIGFIVVIALNADSIALSKYLYSNPDARAKLVASANVAANDTAMIRKMDLVKGVVVDSTAAKAAILDIREKQIQAAKDVALLHDAIPLGWQKTEFQNLRSGKDSIFSKIAGLFATMLAIMLGAPFWFDVLNKISNIRSTGPKPSTTDEKEKKNKATS